MYKARPRAASVHETTVWCSRALRLAGVLLEVWRVAQHPELGKRRERAHDAVAMPELGDADRFQLGVETATAARRELDEALHLERARGGLEEDGLERQELELPIPSPSCLVAFWALLKSV